MRVWIVLDVQCLAYRSFHRMGHLESGGIGTAVAFGLFREMLQLEDRFGSPRMVFCFDSPLSKRREIYPEYKAGRIWSDTDSKRLDREKMQRQVNELRLQHLRDIGFRNIFWQDGYEADDMMAAACNALGPDDRMVLVTSDNDLWQLLGDRVRIWSLHKKELLTDKLFRERWRIAPMQWADVKAIAGCQSDNVKGVRQVGNKRAAAYLAGEFPPLHKVHAALQNSQEIRQRNIGLVRLPFEGTKQVELQDDEVTPDKWRTVLKRLGIKSLRI